MKFDVTSKFWQMANLLSDVVIVNLLFLLLCLPVITIGPALAALIYASNALHHQDDPALLKLFREELKRNFSTKCGLLIFYGMLIFALIGVSLFCYQLESFLGILLFVLFTIILLLTIVAFFIAIAISFQYTSSFSRIIRNSYFVIFVAPAPALALLILLILFPVFVYLTPQILYAMIFIGFVVFAYLMNFCFRVIFKKIH